MNFIISHLNCLQVEWVMSESGDICEGDTWFGRSVINSCVKLAYEHAQEMLDNPSITDYWTEERVNEQVWSLRESHLNLFFDDFIVTR